MSATIRRLFFAAIAAGVLVGIIMTAVYQVTTVPILLEAETYETGQHQFPPARADFASTVIRILPNGTPAVRTWLIHTDGDGDRTKTWAPSDGLERIAYTLIATILLSIGYALILVVGMTLRGGRTDARNGVVWGAGGCIVFTLAPALGLPPEIPGLATADLVDRQIWWIATAVATAIGLWLLVFSEVVILKPAAVAIMVIPHVVGAPTLPEAGASNAPAELAAHFAAASITVGALFWALLGCLSGYFHGKLMPAD